MKSFIVHLRELSSDHKAEDNKHQEAVVLHFFVASREPIWWKTCASKTGKNAFWGH